MTNDLHLDLRVVEQRTCKIASEQLGIPLNKVLPTSRLIEDLHCDSLELVELIMELEDEFQVTIPNEPSNPVGKSIFTRRPFRLCDLAEIIYLQQGTGKPERKKWSKKSSPASEVLANECPKIPFSQLGGRWQLESFGTSIALFESLGTENNLRQFRRRSDGMRCVQLPSAETQIGCDGGHAHTDECPVHSVQLDSFLIDAEPVSTTAYCRFLNSIEANDAHLNDWILLDPTDDRNDQLHILKSDSEWFPANGTETKPIVLVSWFGANAYSLWANGYPWKSYGTHAGFLPTECQWEYAARGAFPNESVQGSDVPTSELIYAMHERNAKYNSSNLPMASVHASYGKSYSGLHHMAGNLWQWCRDWYDEKFYQSPESVGRNPFNKNDTGIRSERGGSWVGNLELCRTSYRRGRNPTARGRCLGFRCVSPVDLLL